MFFALAAVGSLSGQTVPSNPPESRVTAQDAGKSGGYQTDSQQGNANSPTPSPVNGHPAAADKQQESNADKEAIDIQRKLEWFTGILAIVGVLQVGTMIWQAWLLRGTLKEIKTQAGHMERQTKILEDSVAVAQKAADAALANAQAVITSERAWLVVRLKEINKQEIPKDGDMRFGWEIENVGKTPAKLIEAGARAMFDLDANPLPETPNYGFPDTFSERILVPGAKLTLWACWFKLENGIYHDLRQTEPVKIADLLVCFGYVKYRDMFDGTEEHISCFCDGAFIAGRTVGGPVTPWDFAPSGYTKCT